MDDNNPPNGQEDSLVEIEVAEEEEIEVEESESEIDNDKPKPIQNKSKENLSNENLEKNKIEKNNSDLPNINQDIKKNNDVNSKKEELEIEKENISINKSSDKSLDKSIDKSIDKNIDKPYSELELKIIDIMGGSETINNLLNNNNKWDEKKKGFMLLNEFISNLSNKEKTISNFEIFFNYIQDILKNFKESNFIILKEGLLCISSLLNVIKNNKIDDNGINKKYLNILITELNEKIIENKLKNIYIKLINILIDIYSPNDVINYLIQTINKNNKISLLKEYAIFIKDYIHSHPNNIKFLNIKEIIDFCIKLGNNNNPQLRALSSEIISNLYNYIGDDYILYIKNNIKESYFKNIEQKLKYIKNEKSIDNNNLIDNKENNIKKNNEKNLEKEKNNNEKNNDNNNIKKEIKSQNRADISNDITPLLLKYINYGKWNEKKEGIEYIHKLLNDNNNHILINGLQNLIELVIEKLSDSNKNLVKLIIELLSHLIESLEGQLKPYSKNIINQLLSNLSDKNNILRNVCISCINKWISLIQNFETIFTLIPSFLLNDNYDMRNELLNLLINNINIIQKDNYYKNHFEDLINSLLYCLQDKSPNIRNITEKFIKLNIKIIPREDYIKKANKFKPAIMESLSSIINDIYGYHDDCIENRENRCLSRERNISKKRYNKFFSPKKIIINDGEDDFSFTRKDILSKEILSKSIDKYSAKNSFCTPEGKDNKLRTVINEKKKKKIFPHKTFNTADLNQYTKKNKGKFNSFNNTFENYNKKGKKIKIDNKIINDNNERSKMNNSSINNNINNSFINFSSNNKLYKKITKKNSNKMEKEKEKKPNEDTENIATIAKRVNKFYKNSNKNKRASTKKSNNNSKNRQLDKQNISNYKNHFRKIMEEIGNEDNLKVPQRNIFFSPVLRMRENTDTSYKYKLTEDNITNYKKKNNYSIKIGNSEIMTNISGSINKSKNEIKDNLFLASFKIKKENKDKRIDEDRKINYCFEIQNFEKIPKIKETFKNIFCPEFIEKIFSDNIASIIACIDKIKNYIDIGKKDTFLNIENNLDLILKVLGYKLTNNKSSSLIIAMFEFSNSLLISYKKYKLFFNEIETNILLNIFVDKITNNSNIIRDLANNLIWMVIEIIGEEMGLLIIIHLIEYKNIKTKIEAINIIIQLYKTLLGKGKFNFDNWKIKVIKNIINLYFEGDHNNKNKLLFIIKDLYSTFKNDIWKFCKNISSKDKDELLSKIRESQNNNNKHNFDNGYQTYVNTITNSHHKPYHNYIFNTSNKCQEEQESLNMKPKIKTSRMEDKLNYNKIKIKKIKNNLAYNKNNKKVFENRKNIKLKEDDDINNNYQFHSHHNSNLTEIKKNNVKSNLKFEKKIINKNIRDSSIKKNLFFKHMNTTKNIHNQNYENIINQATNKLVLMNNNKQIGKNPLSQSTVIINNNYNFIKIKNNEIQNKKRENSINKNIQNKNIISNNVDKLNDKNNSINIIHSNLNNENLKNKIFVNTNKKEKFNEIKKILENLCSNDKTDMTELILKIHNILYTNYKKNESILITYCDYIFNKLILAINNLLDEKKIYTNYIKYISNVLCKICKLGDLVARINLDTQNNLIILTIKAVALLNENKQNDNNYYYNNSNEENSVIVKCFNSIMLRIIDYGDINNNINIFMNFEKKYRKTDKDIVSYVAKCLILIIKSIKKAYEKIDIGIVIENIYKLLEEMSINNLDMKINNKIDQIIMITIKNFLSQLIIYRGDKELIEYILNSTYKNNNVKNWLLQYIERIKNHRNKTNEKNEENNINNDKDN